MHRTASKVNVFVRAQGHLQLEVYRWACNTKVYEVYHLQMGEGKPKEAGSECLERCRRSHVTKEEDGGHV